jgi:hypothetical protein
MPQPSDNHNQLTFRRLTTPLPTGRVRVQIEARLAGTLLGRIGPVRGGWRYVPAGVGRRAWPVGEVFPTAEECKQALSKESEAAA